MISPETFEQAFIGRIMVIPSHEEIPEEWRDCDGSRIIQSQWPEYFEAMGLTRPVVTLPQQYQVTEGMRAVIKLGRPGSSFR